MVLDPAGCADPSPVSGADTAAFRKPDSLGIPDTVHFGADSHGSLPRAPTHRRTGRPCYGARLASGPPGLALAGQDSHLLDDNSEFHDVTA